MGAPVTGEWQVVAGNRDAYENDTTTAVTTGGTRICVGNNGGTFCRIAFSLSAEIPQYAIVLSGVAEVETWQLIVGTKTKLYAEKIGNSPVLQEVNGNISDRTLTDACIDWDWGGAGDIISPDITTILQEVVNQADYASGNYITFIAVDDGSLLNKYVWVQAFESMPVSEAPVIRAQWQVSEAHTLTVTGASADVIQCSDTIYKTPSKYLTSSTNVSDSGIWRTISKYISSTAEILSWGEDRIFFRLYGAICITDWVRDIWRDLYKWTGAWLETAKETLNWTETNKETTTWSERTEESTSWSETTAGTDSWTDAPKTDCCVEQEEEFIERIFGS